MPSAGEAADQTAGVKPPTLVNWHRQHQCRNACTAIPLVGVW
jgi:hypothetical protein